MVKSTEILGNNSGEIQEFQKPTFEEKLEHFGLEKDDYAPEEFTALKERFESHLSLYERPAELNMRLLEERVDASLDTAEKRKAAFKSWIGEIESMIPKTDRKIPTNINEAKKIVSEQVEKKLFEKLPFLSIFAGTGIGASIVSFINDMRKESGFFGGLISKWLNIDTELNEHDKVVSELTENQAIVQIPDKETVNENETPENILQGSIDDARQKAESVSEDIEVSPESLRESFKISGGIFLREMSGVIFDKRTSGGPGIIYEALGNIEYSDIANQFNNFIEERITYNELLNNLNLGSQGLENKQDFVKDALISMVGINTGNIIRGRLSKEKVNTLIENNNFKERFGLEFYRTVKGKSYFELNFNQISILIMESLPVVISSGISEARSGISRFILGATQSVESEMSVLSEDIKQRKELLISKDLLQAFIDSRTLGLNSLVRKEEDSNMQETIISKLGGNDKDTMIEKAQMEKIIQFKNTILPKIRNSPKFNLGMSGFETAFNNGIDYKKVLELYMLLNGESDLENIDATISLGLYYWISSVLPEQSLQGQYLGSLLKEVTRSLNNEDDILSKEEALLFEGMLGKVSNSFLRVYLEGSSKVMGGISEISKSELEEIFGFEIPEMVNELDLVEWSLVAGLIGSGYIVTKLPIPLQAKLILSGTLTTFGISGALSILHERGTLKKIFDTEGDNELKKSLDKTLKDEMDISLEEAAEMDSEEFSEVIAKAFH